MNFLVGIILVLCGIAIIRYRHPIYFFTGDWAWASRYLGSNGTVVAIVFIGMFLIFAGVAFPLGAFDNPRANLQNTASGSVAPVTPFFGQK